MMTFPIFVAVILTTIAIVVWFRNVWWVTKRKNQLCGMVVKPMKLWMSASENKSMILNTNIPNQPKYLGWVVWSVWFMWIVRRKTIRRRTQMINLASALLLIILGMVICMVIKKSPQTKWEYSGESRKKLNDSKRNEDDFKSGDLLWWLELTIW